MLLREIKNIFHLELDELYSQGEVDSFFYLLIEHHLNLERFVLVIHPDIVISKEEEQPLFEALAQLKLNRPIQYIIGKTTFMDLEFKVDENVLIPRPETEELVRWILKDCQVVPFDQAQDKLARAPKILDIGTGSGCIAITLAKYLPHSEIHALEVTKKASEVAIRNACFHQAEIAFIFADIFKWDATESEYDIIVSNPPYVRETEKEDMSKNVIDYEPGTALFVPDEDPLLFYRRIVEVAKENLKVGGELFLEINQYLAAETMELLEANNFKDIELRKDLFGNDRMLKGRFDERRSMPDT